MRSVNVLAVFAFLLAASSSIWAQGAKMEPVDTYEFHKKKPYEMRYKHDPKKKKKILNADFYCTQCAAEGRIPFKKRDELKQVLETDKKYPYPLEGKTEQHFGTFRLMDKPGEETLQYLFEENKPRKPVFIEDKMFRVFSCNLGSFSTKKDVYPRRLEELEMLSDIFPKISKKTVNLNSHHRAHLYLIRAHRVYNDFVGLVDDGQMKKNMTYLGPYLGTDQKFEIYIFGKRKLMTNFLGVYLGLSDEIDGQCWHNLQDRSLSAVIHADGLRDVDLNNTFTHRLSYNMLTAYRKYRYDLPVWVALGYAHLMERRERTDYNTFIFGEGAIPKLPNKKKWRVTIKKWVLGKKVPRPLAEFGDLTEVGQIPPVEHLVIWSLMSYLMQKDQKAMGKMINILKDKKKGESMRNLLIRALRQSYGVQKTQLWEDWQTWVKETYPSV